MKKLLLFVLVGFIALAPMASADVRTDGMGVRPQQVNDRDLIWLFPQEIENYSLVDYRMEYLGDTDEWGGIIHEDPYIGKWALYVGRPFNGAPYWSSTGSMYITSLFGGIIDGNSTWYEKMSFMGSGMMDNANYIADPENKFDLFKAFPAGNGTVGVRVNFAHSSMNMSEEDVYTSTDPDWSGPWDSYAGKTQVIKAVVGYGMKDLGPFSAFDVAAGYAMGSYDRDMMSYQNNTTNTGSTLDEEETLKGDGINEINLDVRAVKSATEDTDLVTNLNFRTSKLAFEYNYDAYNADGTPVSAVGNHTVNTAEYKSTFIGFGVNCNHKVNEGTGMVVGGVNVQYAKASWTSEDLYNAANSLVVDRIDTNWNSGDEMEMKWLGLWANVGVEANLLKWLQFRAGMSHELVGAVKMTMTDVSSLDTATNAFQDTETTEVSVDIPEDTVMTFGLGITYKNWNIDLLVSKSAIENFLQDGNLGEGLLYAAGPNDGVLDGIAKADITYNF